MTPSEAAILLTPHLRPGWWIDENRHGFFTVMSGDIGILAFRIYMINGCERVDAKGIRKWCKKL
jgi:hypothetical protein